METAKKKAKIIRGYSAADIENWEFDDIDIPEVWSNHLGEIPDRWHMYVDGDGGHGKTEYNMLLSKMLAIHAGKVRLNNVEQGKHKQIMKSARRNEFSKTIPVGKFGYYNIRDFELFREAIRRPNSGKFQIIDSISYWPLNVRQCQELIEEFKKKCFIFVAYEADFKKNKHIQHLCDIKVRVENFVATPWSSRFGGMQKFVVWDKAPEKKPSPQTNLFEATA